MTRGTEIVRHVGFRGVLIAERALNLTCSLWALIPSRRFSRNFGGRVPTFFALKGPQRNQERASLSLQMIGFYTQSRRWHRSARLIFSGTVRAQALPSRKYLSLGSHLPRPNPQLDSFESIDLIRLTIC